MIKTSQLVKDIYKPKDIAQFLGITTRTLQNWDRDNKIHFQRDNVSNRRFMSKKNVIKLLDDNGLLFDDTINKKRDIIYARVSSHEQKANHDLDRQVQFLIDNNDDLQNVLVLSEVGSGLNEKRKKLQKLMKMVINDKVNRVFITNEDRLARCGFHYLKTMFNLKDVEIIVINQ